MGIREPRDGPSRRNAEVRAGQTITVTDHGTPVDRPTALERLVAEGIVQPPVRTKTPAADPVDGGVALSEIAPSDRR
ncbi:hypothetical protein [Modestobacter sp. Leaf380]|uniref:hypothetical protein n=1 Tax=Modestobacter sp. Leaf380 TaxID=1736356 RepID=UPI0006FA01B1|nr:hypothetical protein [Modestobacter sp. Leaf380]KQS69262.1 hypothetical protein ASG41_21860 [Modestobacter sp. Leaf380]